MFACHRTNEDLGFEPSIEKCEADQVKHLPCKITHAGLEDCRSSKANVTNKQSLFA